jgi:hypothetical protein
MLQNYHLLYDVLCLQCIMYYPSIPFRDMSPEVSYHLKCHLHKLVHRHVSMNEYVYSIHEIALCRDITVGV